MLDKRKLNVWKRSVPGTQVDYSFKHKKPEIERGQVGGLDQNLCDFTKWNKPVKLVRSGKCSREFGEN